MRRDYIFSDIHVPFQYRDLSDLGAVKDFCTDFVIPVFMIMYFPLHSQIFGYSHDDCLQGALLASCCCTQWNLTGSRVLDLDDAECLGTPL